MPLPGVFTDHALNDFQKVFVCGLCQTIPSWIVWRRSQASNVVFLEKPENFFRNECSIVIANDFERNAKVGEYVILQKVHHLFGFRSFKCDDFGPSSEIVSRGQDENVVCG